MEFTETGRLVYDRTYSRTKPDGSKETWPETVVRVVDGNLALVDSRYHEPGERETLVSMMTEFKVVPAGRHLWASGVKNAQHLFNCWVSGWTPRASDHFHFSFMRLMEGGGVGSSYSNRDLEKLPRIEQWGLDVHIVCHPEHPDFEKMKGEGLLSTEYDDDWPGAFPVEDSREGWAAALVDLLDTFYRPEVAHKQRVYDVSRVRCAGARLMTFGGRASGPAPLATMLREVSYIMNRASVFGARLTGLDAMEIDHEIAQCVVSGGVRRSARMAMMHWADEQIMSFIRCKADGMKHWTTNISVEVDNDFWDALDDYKNPSRAYALSVLAVMSAGMLENGEPGYWDSSLSNVGEPNRVVCTNPCGEITLEPWEPCNLGHVNLAAFVDGNGIADLKGIAEAHRLMARFLIRATFSAVSDPKSREVLDRNRRIGVGHLGVASYLAMTGVSYSAGGNPATLGGTGFQYELMNWAETVDDAARDYAHELRIPMPVKSRTVAPTGTIAKMPGVSEGIHPVFSKYFIRRIRFSKVDPSQMAQVETYRERGFTVEQDVYDANTLVVEIPTKDSLMEAVAVRFGEAVAEDVVQGANDLSLIEQLRMQALYQSSYADNAVSFTVNVTPGEVSPGDLAEAVREYGGILKGCTVFPDASRPQSPYERITREQYEAYETTETADGVNEDCANGACPIK